VVNLIGAAQKEMAASMTNFGRVVMAGGVLYVMNNNDVNYRGFITNAGIWDMEGNLMLAQYWENDFAGFGNGGSFRKTAGTGIGIVNLPFVNEGTVRAQSGILRFDHGMRLEGSFVTSAGAAILFNAGSFVYVPPNRFTGPGLFALTGGTLQGLDNYLPNFELKGGTVYLSPTYQTNGPIVRLDMNGATLGGSNYVVGVLNATNGGIAGPLNLATSAVVTFAGTYAYGPTLVESNATFNWLGGRFGTGSSLLVQSNAVVNILGAAEKQMGGPMTNFGSVLWSGGGFTIMNESSSYLGFVTNLGIWEMQGNLTMNQYWGNNNERFGNRGSFLKTLGTGTGVISVPISNPAGFINVLSGTLRFDNGLNLDGQFTAGPATVMQFNAGTFIYTPQTRLLGSGLFRLTGGALQDLGDYLPNLQLQGGSVSLSPTYQTNGPIVRLDLDGAMLTGSNRVSGVMNFNSGQVSGPLNILGNGTLNWSSGRFTQGSSLNINSNALANLITNSGKEIGGPLTNSGTVLWTAGGLSLLNDAATWKGSVVNSGIWETRGDLNMDQYFGNNFSSFQNSGTLRKTTGTGTATMDVVFVNQGIIEQLSGIWTFGRNFSLTEGTVLFGISSDTAFGRINLTGTASLAGKLAARLLGGYVPATNRTFQVMNYGVVAGTFTDYSGLDVGSGRAFAPVYTSSSLTLQTYATSSETPIMLSDPAITSNYFTFLFTGEPSKTYTIQYCTNLADPAWSTLLVTNIPVSPARVTDLTSSTSNRFYRVKLGSP
jgi:hypothetical protein